MISQLKSLTLGEDTYTVTDDGGLAIGYKKYSQLLPTTIEETPYKTLKVTNPHDYDVFIPLYALTNGEPSLFDAYIPAGSDIELTVKGHFLKTPLFDDGVEEDVDIISIDCQLVGRADEALKLADPQRIPVVSILTNVPKGTKLTKFYTAPVYVDSSTSNLYRLRQRNGYTDGVFKIQLANRPDIFTADITENITNKQPVYWPLGQINGEYQPLYEGQVPDGKTEGLIYNGHPSRELNKYVIYIENVTTLVNKWGVDIWADVNFKTGAHMQNLYTILTY